MRRLSIPIALALSLALACSSSDSGPRDPYVAAPVTASVAGNSSFLQRVPVQDGDVSLFPDAANQWDLQGDLGLSDGSDDQFDGALELFVGTLPTKPATWDSLYAETWGLETFPWDQTYGELTFYEPTYAAADLRLVEVMDSTQAYYSVLEGTYSAYLAPTGDSGLQQTVNLASATGTVTLAWTDNAFAYPGAIGSYAPHFRVVVRSTTTGDVLETVFDGTFSSGSHSYDLTPYAGQAVVLAFEYRADWGYGIVDAVSVTDGNATEFVTNGDFETGDLAGWTAATGGQSQNLVGGTRSVGGLEVTRGFYAAPGSLWARWVDVFENTGATAVTADVVYYTNLGSDDAGIIYDTPSAAGRAISSWDGDNSDRDVAIVYGTGQAYYVSDDDFGAYNGSDYVFVLHTITVPAGGKVALVHFIVMNGVDTADTATSVSDHATAIDQAAAAISSGVGNNPVYLDWMTAEQRAVGIANW